MIFAGVLGLFACERGPRRHVRRVTHVEVHVLLAVDADALALGDGALLAGDELQGRGRAKAGRRGRDMRVRER
jgi:hypothetical protein